MGLRDFFKPAWQHSDQSKREEAVRHLDNTALVAMVFGSDPSSAVKHAALQRLVALDRQQGESLFSVLQRYNLDASAIAFLNSAEHLSELVGNLGESTWRPAIIKKLRQSDAAAWPTTSISIVSALEQSDDPELRAFAQETVRKHQLPLAQSAVLLALLRGLSVKAIGEIDRVRPVSAWVERRDARTEFFVQNGKSDGWGTGIITCRSAEEAAHEFVIAVGPKAALEAAGLATAAEKVPQGAGAAKTVVGRCERCNRELRVKATAVRSSMTLTCKCRHVSRIQGVPGRDDG